VDTEEAFFTNPSLGFVLQEFTHPILADKFQIFNFAHSVSRPVSQIQALQAIARKFRAIVTKFAGAFIANSQSAVQAGFRFVFLGISAAMTGVFLAQVRFAYSAVHPAGGNQIFADFVGHASIPS
jgi:hypothetical protein